MHVENVHERTLHAPLASVETLIDSLSSHDDLLWPRDRWPVMRFDRPLSVGAAGGHGPVRYFVESYVPGRSIRFRFTAPRVFDGFHGYEVVADGPERTRLRHVVDMKTRGHGVLTWPLLFRPLHDALIEDSLDRAQQFCGGAPEASSWSPWVRALRWAFRKSRRRRSLALSAILLFSLSGRLSGQELQFADMGVCRLESGAEIQDCRIGYRAVGTIAPDRDNVVLFPTWFSGTSEQILRSLGPEALIDTSKFFVVVVDAFGNGVSSSPSNSAAQSGAAFPRVTIRDMVRQQHRLLTEKLGISGLKAVVGISMGGMQAFEWAVSYPGFAEKIVPIVGSPRLAVYDIVLWETDVRILDWYLACECQPPAAVRSGLFFLMGGPHYHSRLTPRDSLPRTRASLEAAALTRDRAYDLKAQLHAMIGHDVAAPYDGSLERAASRVQAELLVVVGLTDHVVTAGPALEFARHLGAATLEFGNDCGHQAPWCEVEDFYPAVRDFLAK